MRLHFIEFQSVYDIIPRGPISFQLDWSPYWAINQWQLAIKRLLCQETLKVLFIMDSPIIATFKFCGSQWNGKIWWRLQLHEAFPRMRGINARAKEWIICILCTLSFTILSTNYKPKHLHWVVQSLMSCVGYMIQR